MFNVWRLNERRGAASSLEGVTDRYPPALSQSKVYQHTLLAVAFNVGRLNERRGAATALSQHNVYQHTLYAVAFNVGRLNTVVR